MPRLTVKAAAEMLQLPAFSQARILTEQKYPKAGSQSFRTPFYRSALNGIVSYFKNDRDKGQIVKARSKALAHAQPARRDNNIRVLNSFEKSDLFSRDIESIPNSRFSAEIGDVEFKLSPDLRGFFCDKPILLYLNCRAQALDPEIARLTIEIAHWVTEQNNEGLKISQIEFVDLFTNITYSFKSRRASTIKALSENANIIDTLWPTL